MALWSERSENQENQEQWTPVEDARTYEIRVFDDGNQGLMSKPNAWRIVARWKGKVRLRNCFTCSVDSVVQSISEWKVVEVET